MAKAKLTHLSVDELNDRCDEIDREIAELREEKKRIAEARATRIQEEQRIVQLFGLSEDVLAGLKLDKTLLERVKAYKLSRPQNQPAAQRVAPEPVRGKAAARK